MENKKSTIISYISNNPSLSHDPVKLARLIVSENDGYSLKEVIKGIKDTLPELLDEGEGSGYKKIIVSKKTIKTKVDNEFDGNASAAARAMGVPERSMRRWYHDPESKKDDGIKRFVVTYGQNNTPVHLGFYKSLQHYLKKNNAELIVYQGRYKNPTSIIEASKSQDEVWDAKIRPYLLNTERKLNNKITIFPANTNPTAVTPLSGFDITTDNSGVFPHPKYQLKTVPTPSKSLPKILSTTGAITIPNYSKSKAGMKSIKNHIIGAVVVEIVDDKKFHIRQISAADDGSFYDIVNGECRNYSVDGVGREESIEAIVGGDIHMPFAHEPSINATFDQIDRFKPKEIFLHDLIDCWSVNHHEINNRFLNTAKQANGLMNVEHEVNESVMLLDKFAKAMPKNGKVHVVPSNHNDALDKWLHNADIDKLGINSVYFHYLSWRKHQSAKITRSGFEFIDAYAFSAEEKLMSVSQESHEMVHFMKRDTPYLVKDIDCSMHGDQGSNGARGGTKGFSKIGVKTITGHCHSPAVIDGAYSVGVLSIIPLGYAKGSSSWLNTSCFIYPSGKRTLINMIDGEYYL